MFKPHYPSHLYFNQQIYFVTTRTVTKGHLFNTHEKKRLLMKVIKEAALKFHISIYAWVILGNHYHLLFQIPNGKDLPNFIQVINGKSAFLLNKFDGVQKRKVWFNYWDHCIRDETDFWKHFNYIHQNPVKHGLCKNLIEAFSYPFSSAKQWVKMKGEEWLFNSFQKYPIVDYTDDVN